MLFGCTPLACDAFSLCSRIRATSAFSRVFELLKSGCGDRREAQCVAGKSRWYGSAAHRAPASAYLHPRRAPW
eukprot:scaffold17166_cov69-Phaeocystis_antarctica.AAC.1